MNPVDLADAEVQLRELVDRVEAGGSIDIVQRGRPVARLSAIARPRKPIDVDLLRSVTETMPAPSRDAADLVRAMRDDDRG